MSKISIAKCHYCVGLVACHISDHGGHCPLLADVGAPAQSRVLLCKKMLTDRAVVLQNMGDVLPECLAGRYLGWRCCQVVVAWFLQWKCALLQVQLGELAALLRLGDCMTLGLNDAA